MPEPSTDTPVTEMTSPEPTSHDAATPNWERVERERLTRRAALRKMGYTSGIALFSMFAVDDLARMAIKQMEQHKETRQIAETIAKEFKNVGVALANPNSSGCIGGGNVIPGCAGSDIGYNCVCCPTAAPTSIKCVQDACLRCFPNGLSLNPIYYADKAAYNKCLKAGQQSIASGEDYICT